MSYSEPQISEITYGDLRDDLNKQAKRYSNKSVILICLGCSVLLLASLYYCVFGVDSAASIYVQLVPATLSLIVSVIFISFGAHFARLYSQAVRR